MGRPRTRKPRKYSEFDINGNLSNLSIKSMKPMKREDSKIKFVENHPCPWGYKCHCGKILKHWNPSVLLNNIRLHLEVKTLITGWLLAWQMHACMCHGMVHRSMVDGGGPTIWRVRLQLGILFNFLSILY